MTSRVAAPLRGIDKPHIPVCDSLRSLNELAAVVVDDATWFQNFCLAFRGRLDFSTAELEKFMIVSKSFCLKRVLLKGPQLGLPAISVSIDQIPSAHGMVKRGSIE